MLFLLCNQTLRQFFSIVFRQDACIEKGFYGALVFGSGFAVEDNRTGCLIVAYIGMEPERISRQ